MQVPIVPVVSNTHTQAIIQSPSDFPHFLISHRTHYIRGPGLYARRERVRARARARERERERECIPISSSSRSADTLFPSRFHLAALCSTHQSTRDFHCQSAILRKSPKQTLNSSSCELKALASVPSRKREEFTWFSRFFFSCRQQALLLVPRPRLGGVLKKDKPI